MEILKLNKTTSTISASLLVQAVCNLNAHIRHNGLSAKEMFLGRDQIDGSRLRFSDKFLSTSQNQNRVANHLPSATSKARGGAVAKQCDVSEGSLVFIKHEGNKFNPRESYIVVQRNGDTATVQKMDKGKFRSRQYVVPLSHIFPCIDSSYVKEKKKEVVESSSSSDDDDDIIISSGYPTVINPRHQVKVLIIMIVIILQIVSQAQGVPLAKDIHLTGLGMRSLITAQGHYLVKMQLPLHGCQVTPVVRIHMTINNLDLHNDAVPVLIKFQF